MQGLSNKERGVRRAENDNKEFDKEGKRDGLPNNNNHNFE